MNTGDSNYNVQRHEESLETKKSFSVEWRAKNEQKFSL